MTREATLAARATAAIDAMGASRERRLFHVPGRIEVLGKHTDYAGGRSLLCAVDRGIVVAVAPRADEAVRARNADAAGEGTDLHVTYADPVRAGRSRATHWWLYATTVISRIGRDFPEARAGADIAFASDLPMDSGLSSSSALVVALFLALDAVNGLSRSPRYRAAIPTREALAEYLGAVENGRSFGSLEAGQGVGTLGGSEDHTAILCCHANTLARYSFCPVRAEDSIPLPRDTAFVVAFSGVAAAKAGNALDAYNEASRSTVELLSVWNAATGSDSPTLAAALDSRPDAYERLRDAVRRASVRGFSTQRLLDRLEQFNVESRQIIPAACDALRVGDLVRFGELVDASQHNAERLLGNQVPETIALARSARALGAQAASAFGGGFGGSVWAMTPAALATEFASAWRARYAAEFADAATRAVIFATSAQDGAHALPGNH
jgi:galactokinase